PQGPSHLRARRVRLALAGDAPGARVLHGAVVPRGVLRRLLPPLRRLGRRVPLRADQARREALPGLQEVEERRPGSGLAPAAGMCDVRLRLGVAPRVADLAPGVALSLPGVRLGLVAA